MDVAAGFLKLGRRKAERQRKRDDSKRLMCKESSPATVALSEAGRRLRVRLNPAVKSSSPQFAIACKVLRLKLEKIAEADIRSAYGEFVQYPEVGEISAQVYEETVRWLEFIAGIDAP